MLKSNWIFGWSLIFQQLSLRIHCVRSIWHKSEQNIHNHILYFVSFFFSRFDHWIADEFCFGTKHIISITFEFSWGQKFINLYNFHCVIWHLTFIWAISWISYSILVTNVERVRHFMCFIFCVKWMKHNIIIYYSSVIRFGDLSEQVAAMPNIQKAMKELFCLFDNLIAVLFSCTDIYQSSTPKSIATFLPLFLFCFQRSEIQLHNRKHKILFHLLWNIKNISIAFRKTIDLSNDKR